MHILKWKYIRILSQCITKSVHISQRQKFFGVTEILKPNLLHYNFRGNLRNIFKTLYPDCTKEQTGIHKGCESMPWISIYFLNIHLSTRKFRLGSLSAMLHECYRIAYWKPVVPSLVNNQLELWNGSWS